MRWQTVLAGVLALALLEVTVSSNAAAGRVGGLLDATASVVSHVLSPTVAAIPDLRTKGGAAPSAATDQSSTSSGSTMPADWSTSASALYA